MTIGDYLRDFAAHRDDLKLVVGRLLDGVADETIVLTGNQERFLENAILDVTYEGEKALVTREHALMPIATWLNTLERR